MPTVCLLGPLFHMNFTVSPRVMEQWLWNTSELSQPKKALEDPILASKYSDLEVIPMPSTHNLRAGNNQSYSPPPNHSEPGVSHLILESELQNILKLALMILEELLNSLL